MRAVLIYPPSPFLLEERVMPPLGILFIANFLEKNGHEVHITDLTGVAEWKSPVRAMLDWNPDVIGFTGTTPQYPISLRIKDYIRKEQGWKGPLVIGGIHVTSDPDGVARDGWNAHAIGEGEQAMLQIVDEVKHGKEQIGEVKMPLMPNLDEYGHPARHLLDIRSYKYSLGDAPASTTFSQRGCVFRCAFCESPLAGGFTVRFHSPQWVYDDANILKDYGFKGIMFFDDEFNINIPRLHEICKLLRPLDMKFRCFFVASKSSPDILKALKDAGCYELGVGFESGSPELLKNIHKPQTVDIVRKFARQAKEIGIRWKAFTIMGLPGETWETVSETEKLLEECSPDDLDVSILQIYPGSPIHLHAEEYHRKGLEWEIDYESAWYKSSPEQYAQLIRVNTPGMSRSDLIAARNYLESKFKPPEWREKFSKKMPWDRLDADLVYVREWARKLSK